MTLGSETTRTREGQEEIGRQSRNVDLSGGICTASSFYIPESSKLQTTGRKQSVSRSLKHLFHSSNKFVKTLKRWVLNTLSRKSQHLRNGLAGGLSGNQVGILYFY